MLMVTIHYLSGYSPVQQCLVSRLKSVIWTGPQTLDQTKPLPQIVRLKLIVCLHLSRAGMYLGQVMKKILSHKVTAAHNVNVSKSCPSFLNGILQLLKGSDFEWAIPASFRSFLTILQKKLQSPESEDHQSRRRASCPFDHHHQPNCQTNLVIILH